MGRTKWAKLSALDTRAYARALAEASRRYKEELALIGEMGKALADQIYGPFGFVSLREAARRSGLSPTYLSMVRSGEKRISVEAYGKLARLLFKQDAN